jgi:two-component system, chemotaxis family, response regulator Rcp1
VDLSHIGVYAKSAAVAGRSSMIAESRVRTAEVLLVEDNPADVRLFREALRDRKAELDLHVVDNGEDALRFLRREGPFHSAPKPDLIVLDLNLPRKDGREVLAEVKQDPGLRRIPVVVLTTSNAESDVTRAYDLHANCYLRKPSDLDEFISAVRACESFWLNIVRLPER